ncbi:BTAD domain-containing putative transcriptional regulator [Streptomyces sp. NPDC092952]|uniref:AfsR/SARP family transcriptional regulator n=1 Tax=Streptomyces sp. NPDC092952 TaxID=3366018 RepID=UPI0037F8EC0B
MEFRLLGRVGVISGAGELQPGPAKRRGVLAALLLKANSPVSVDRLIGTLWDTAPPVHARTVVQGHVSRLRALLNAAGAGEHGVRLLTRGPSYVFEVPETLLDTYRFERLVRRGRSRLRPADTVADLTEALALWHGPALDGTAPSSTLRAAAQALEEDRLAAVETLAEGYGRLGDAAGAVAVLQAEAEAHPLRESLAGALVGALHRAGRRSDALDHYHRTRRLLAAELGVDPGAGLRREHETVLRASGKAVERRRSGAAEPVAPGEGGAVPRLLPRGIRGFLGRDAELAELDRAAGAGVPALVTGAPGVGKSALALHWAHHAQSRYPGGTLYADLRGFGGVPAEPAQVVREFLLALGVPAHGLPESAACAAALYRELTGRRALLVVLDDARGSDQVRPLLPAGTGSAVLVTSRLRLGGLAVEELARPVRVDALAPAPAADLLAAAVGEDRVAAEPGAAERLARLCDGLPLALRIAAAQLAARPHWQLADLAAELADEQRRLALLSLDDAQESGVAAVLRSTVRGLAPEAVRLFALLGVVPGPDLDRYAAAALLGRPAAVAAEALDRLAGAHLVTEHAPGRYSPPDLVRLYARGLTADDGALLRLLDGYAATALAASLAAEPGDKPCCALPATAVADLPVRRFADRDAALRWYAAECDNLAAAVTAARAAGHEDRAWRLAVLQWPYVVWSVRDGWVPLLEQALAASSRVGDPDAESRVRALLGWVLTREGRLSEALAHLEAAPALAARAHDPSSEAIALINLAVALDTDGITDTSLRHVTRAVRLAREADDVLTELLALQHRTYQLLTRGDVAAAESCTAYALALDDQGVTTGLGVMRRATLRLSRGEALLALGEREAAERCVRQALAEATRQGFQEGVNRARYQLARLKGTVAPQTRPGGDNRSVLSP